MLSVIKSIKPAVTVAEKANAGGTKSEDPIPDLQSLPFDQMRETLEQNPELRQVKNTSALPRFARVFGIKKKDGQG